MSELFPRVVLSGQTTVFRLKKTDGNLFGKATVTVQSMEAYRVPHTRNYRIDEQGRNERFEVSFQNGEARFECLLRGEQRHRIVCEAEGKRETFEVYSLQEDLYGLNPYKGDSHIHSTASDGCSSPLQTAIAYYAAGFDYIALTDHHVYEESAKLFRKIRSVLSGFRAFAGEEVHNRKMGYFHIINFGGARSVNEIVNADPDGLMDEISKTEDEVALRYGLPPSLDKTEFAFRVWVSERIREFGGMSVLCHPFWDAYGEYNVQTDMLEFLLKNGVFDAFELVDDTDSTGNGCNLQTEFYNELRGQGIRIPIVGASDCHDISSELFGKFFTYAFCGDLDEVPTAIRSLRTVAVEKIGKEYRVHGPFRLVKYTRFLIDCFENGARLIRAREAESVLSAIEKGDFTIALSSEAKSFAYRNLFFGRENPPV